MVYLRFKMAFPLILSGREDLSGILGRSNRELNILEPGFSNQLNKLASPKGIFGPKMVFVPLS
jgi:hypothetical protein